VKTKIDQNLNVMESVLSDMLDKKDQDTPKNASIFLESELIFTTINIESDFILVDLPYKKYTPHYYSPLYNFDYLKSSFKPPAPLV